jgi:hypothetical protein
MARQRLSGRVGFELADGGQVGGLAAEEVDDFDGGAEGGQRVDLEDVQRLDALMPLSAYLSSSASRTARAFSPYLAKTLRFLTFSARSRRVSGGWSKATWQTRSKAS